MGSKMADAFNPDQYLAQKTGNVSGNTAPPEPFDPNQYLAQKTGQAASTGENVPRGTQAQAGLEGAGQGLLMGYLPQIQAKAEPITDRIFNLFNGQKTMPAPWSQLTSNGPEYIQARDANIQRMQNQAQDYPKTALAGQIGGGVAGAALTPIPGLGASKGLLSAIGKGAASGAVLGAVQNPGDVQGQVDPLQASDRLSNAQSGALTGGLIGGAVKGSQNLATAASGLQDYAERKAFKSSGAMLKDFRQAFDKGRVNELGKTMLDQGLVKAGDTFENVAQKTEALRQQTGSQIGDIYKQIQGKIDNPQVNREVQAAGFQPKANLDELKSLIKGKFEGTPGGQAVIARVEGDLDQMAATYGDKLGIKDALGIKHDWDNEVNFAKRQVDMPKYQQAATMVRNYIRDKMNNQANTVGQLVGTDLGDQLKAANRSYQNLSEISSIAQDRIARENANRMFGLTDTIAGGAGGALAGAAAGALSGDTRHGAEGAVLGGIGTALLHKAARTYGNPILATGANALSRAAQYTATPLGQLANQIPPGLLEQGLLRGRNKGFLTK